MATSQRRRVARKLEHRGSIFQTNSDTEVIVHLIARSQARNLSGAIGDALNQVEGAYSLLVLTQDEPTPSATRVASARSFSANSLPRGFDSWLVASETCAFDLLNAQYIREIEPGEMVPSPNPASSPSISRRKARFSSAFSSTSIPHAGQHHLGRP